MNLKHGPMSQKDKPKTSKCTLAIYSFFLCALVCDSDLEL